MLERIAEATKGTDRELGVAGLLAEAFRAAGRRAEAEARMREVLARAAEREDHRLASHEAQDLINLLRSTGRTEEALGLVETMKEATRQAGLGPWTQLCNEGVRLQLLADLGRYDEVLAEVEAFRPRMDALPSTGTQHEYAYPWNVREVLLHAGVSAALRLERWEEALSFNAQVVASTEARGASSLEVTRARYNDYRSLIELDRRGEAYALLLKCREVYESESYLPGLGQVFNALATLESNVGHADRAIRHGQSALRYFYSVGEPGDCAISHLNLATFLLGFGDSPTESLAHRLAGMVIFYQTASGHFSICFRDLCCDLASFAPGEPPLPADFAALCATVDQVEGVDLASLFNRLPKTRAGTGDDALRQVLDLARQQPPTEPSPV
jgi:tetratricopeptide (TPR) repeat protein